MQINLTMTFDAGHRIVGHKGKCARLHGHTYKAQIVALGQIREPGFVCDFGDIKDLVNEWDHRLLLWEDDATSFVWLNPGNYSEEEIGIVRLPFNPTAENMARYLATEIRDRFDLDTVSVELWETPNASARYHA